MTDSNIEHPKLSKAAYTTVRDLRLHRKKKKILRAIYEDTEIRF